MLHRYSVLANYIIILVKLFEIISVNTRDVKPGFFDNQLKLLLLLYIQLLYYNVFQKNM